MKRFISHADAMEALGSDIARDHREGGIIYLQGELGAGKTTLARGIIRAFGITEPVKSPTYTLVESYTASGRLSPRLRIYHLDLYRLQDPEELEYIGIRDYFGEKAMFLIEWPERGKGGIPAPDLVVSIAVLAPGRLVTLGNAGCIPKI
uniref:tRNA threonylcarbamoyladenosine biosynthesis protein TsaE n=1 Tax=Candidatus Kentrum sp. FM TaxID=2126340 RepID=A0A450W198_9GAMM|nr:MAG: tRNA threonylcarbamoyladenosine biosynthesis protein TsaE [Candidatus Kentron sp. FM]VFJ56425.1 MAG: tRNA threonylcarbamoyladenosine biosynthesis protein TsaE [Candidatus Kentron sp. FM]VFK10834.1 MAG: tRNA threonylcarbamoyladenosine biosynthesis protein TsaE [Candidatus Kentron sp. FM]